ncbi:FixW_protein [Hexamita inflata]|uniref:Putative n=1 Tax=Hexamita inflata TaxID=28002 RepID=A0AA86NFD4_9EUKA|nr:FixW protein [Hexamita inflata]CAI9943768.1 FixW protein [Hexamita inflata]
MTVAREFNKHPPKSHAMPDLSKLTLINVARARDASMPVVLVSMHTNSGECRNVAPFYVQLHDRFPRLYFLHISFQPYDEIISNFANIPELMQLNVAHDGSLMFKQFLFLRNTLAIPYMFIFNQNGTIIFEGHPLSKPVEGHLCRLSGQAVLNNTYRSPMRSVSQLKGTGTKGRAGSPLRSMVFK